MENFENQCLYHKKWWKKLLMACSAAWAIQFHYGAQAADRGAGIVDVLLIVACYLLFCLGGTERVSRSIRKRSAALAIVFVLCLAVGGDWFSAIRYGKFTNVPLYICYYLNAFVGTFLLFRLGINLLLGWMGRLDPIGDVPSENGLRTAFLCTFAVCFSVYLLFLFNQYPGSMESDHMRQLKHLLDGELENRNPLISSLLVYACVSLVRGVGGTMNMGIFFYSIVQIGILTASISWAVALLYRSGIRRSGVFAAALFSALIPYNVFYSYGMWKDTLFAALLLLTLCKVWSMLLTERDGGRSTCGDWIALFALSLFCALSRNSGLLALLTLAPCLYLAYRKWEIGRKGALTLAAALAAALVVMGPVYAALGVAPTADSVSVACVPLQQVGQLIVEDKPFSEEDAALLAEVLDFDEVRTNFDPYCADPMKDAIYPHIDTFDANKNVYIRLWIRLGAENPVAYFRAYKNLLRMYFDPNLSSEVAYKWIYQNDFGVYRDAKLLPSVDFGYYEFLLELPAVNLLKRPGAILWWMLILCQVFALRGNRKVRVLMAPLFAVIGGLFFIAPVALFRYVYALFLCLPFMTLWPFIPLQEKRMAQADSLEGTHETVSL